MCAVNRFDLPDLGIGLGLRTVHYADILRREPDVDWFEILSENYLQTEGRPLLYLDRVAERYPVVMHGVSLSIGSTDPLDFDYLREFARLRDRVGARWVSDHLCWTSYFSRLEECLADDYPAVKYALGDAGFEALCRGYVGAHPSRSANLNGFGAGFATFAGEQALENGAFIADLARLEWAVVEVLHAPTPDGFSPADLGKLPPARLQDVRFEPSPAARVLSVEFAVNGYLQAFRDAEAPGIPARRASTVVVARNGYQIHRFELERGQAAVLHRLLAGDPLGVALTGIDAAASTVQAWFRQWTERGVFAEVAVTDGTDRIPPHPPKSILHEPEVS
jgi:hypothetical protein